MDSKAEAGDAEPCPEDEREAEGEGAEEAPGLPASGSLFREEHRREVLAVLEAAREGGEEAHAAGKLDWARARAVLEEYQEQGQLLRRALPELAGALVAAFSARAQQDEKQVVAPLGDAAEAQLFPTARRGAEEEDEDAPRSYIHEVCRLAYVLAKVVGPKTLVPHLPHDVRQFEFVFYYLLRSVREDPPRTWEVRYFLMLWLANIVLVPFDFASIDSKLHSSLTLTELLVLSAQHCLRLPGREREIGAFFIARLLTRPDLARSPHLPRFFQWCAAELAADAAAAQSAPFGRIGALLAVAQILKIGNRGELLPHLPLIADVLTGLAAGAAAGSNALQNKIHVKATQRLGLVYLPPRVVSWRYQRGLRSLAENLRAAGCAVAEQAPAAAGAAAQPAQEGDDGSEDSGAPEELEAVIGTVLEALRDQDTVVRWSAAKGVGRITARLGRHEAQDVLNAVLELFGLYEDCNGWHGGCLALAELARRGLLLPAAFDRVLPITLRALEYEVAKGSYSVGRHVRDAGCYVCWAFARAYAPQDIAAYVHSMACSLLCAACYDREINVRRAAAAAFQECVGRLGNFPHGIDIVTKADYFTLSSRPRAFVEVGPSLAALDPVYLKAFTRFAVDSRLCHSDRSVRSLAAEALGALAGVDPEGVVGGELQGLLGRCLSATAADARHGALLAVAELVRKHPAAVPTALLEELAAVVPRLDQNRLYRGRGGELVRAAACRLVRGIADAGLPLPETIEVEALRGKKRARTLAKYQESLDDHLRQPSEDVQSEAAAAFRAFAARFYAPCPYEEKFHGKILEKLTASLLPPSPPNVRRGAALALGAFPRFQETRRRVVEALVPCCAMEQDAESRDAESRRNACSALAEAACADAAGLEEEVFCALEGACADYGVDSRGDVGSFVRIAAMTALRDLAAALAARGALSADRLLRLLRRILRQLAEKLDRVRACAGRLLAEVVRAHLQPCDCPLAIELGEVAAVVTKIAETPVSDWGAPQETFPCAALALGVPGLRRAALEGFVASAGGLSVHVARPAFEALAAYLRAAPDARQAAMDLVQVLRDHPGDERVVLPFFAAADKLLAAGAWPPEAGEELAEATRAELRASSKDIRVLLQASGVLGALVGLLSSGEARNRVLHAILLLLAGRFPKVRAKVGEMLYTALLAMEQPPPGAEAAMELLLQQQWDATDAAAVRGARDRLYPLLGLVKPQSAPSAGAAPRRPAAPAAPAADENAMYATLIRDVARGDR
eukprot:TRINITY_DN3687_c0_g1_i1.p1 TRINITY_DN3687_c0_g1~~TRINITY_DN3687_c0_g1_i1.p1  ORF type:complete len:1250 (+),score=425.28 TRINITY_DN3687_c0_g1_i1:96-3845(+)